MKDDLDLKIEILHYEIDLLFFPVDAFNIWIDRILTIDNEGGRDYVVVVEKEANRNQT